MGVQEGRGMVSNVISRETVGCFTVEIQYDPDPPNPVEEWDNLGTMILFSTTGSGLPSHLGDKHQWRKTDRDLPWLIEQQEGPILFRSLHLRGDCGIYAGDPGEWDAEYCDGLIYVTKEDARQDNLVKRLTPKVRENVLRVLKGEVETYGDFLTGACYGWVVKDPWGEHVDSCWGIYGLDYAKEAGREAAEHLRTTEEYRTMPDLPECSCSASWAPEFGHACCCRDEEEKEAVCS